MSKVKIDCACLGCLRRVKVKPGAAPKLCKGCAESGCEAGKRNGIVHLEECGDPNCCPQ